ncbi:MAG: hypothetical protein JSV73_05775, partial [Flavobacteriaceae bacterium]
MKRFILVSALLFYFFGFSQNNSAILSNFRIEDKSPDRVYFDVDGDISGISKKGFDISGRKITQISTTSNFFKVNKPFTFWDNNTIRLEGGDGTVVDFTLTYIQNNISEPDSSTYRYVSVTGSGNRDGTSESNAWTLEEAFSEATSGMTVWIKAGNYGNKSLSVRNSGNIGSPIKFIGYEKTVGDLDDRQAVDIFSYTSSNAAASFIDSRRFPVLSGVEEKGSYGIIVKDRSYIVFKNIQLQKFFYQVFLIGKTHGVYLKNVTAALGYEAGASNGGGYGIYMGTTTTGSNVRIDKCLSFDNGVANYRLYGNSHAIVNSASYSGINTNQSTDYYISLYKSHHSIIHNNYVERVGNIPHKGHAIGIKNGDSKSTSTFNLLSNNVSRNITGENFYFAHQGTSKNVIKGNFADAGTFLAARNGAHDNIYENNSGEDLNFCIYLWANKEAYPFTSGRVADNNLFRNNIFNGSLRGVVYSNEADRAYDLTNNKILNNTFYNIRGGFFYRPTFEHPLGFS